MSSSLKKSSVTRNAAVMGAATFLSRIAGLVREQTFAYFFGAGRWTDAFNVAFRIPNLLRNLFAEGAMSAAFVPTFNEILQNEGKKRAFRLTNLTVCTLLIIISLVTIIGIAASPWLVQTLAPEFIATPEKYEVTVTMTRIMFPFLLVISLAAIAMGILNSLGEFFIPAIAPIFLNGAMILAGFTLCPWMKSMGYPAIVGMALGAMLGGLFQLFAQLPTLFRAGYRFKWTGMNFKDKGMRRIVKLIIPGTIGLAATQINVAISTILATTQGDGAVSWLNYSFRLMQLPLGIFGVAIAQATLPVISRQAAQDDHQGMVKTLASSIKLTAFINIFSCFALLALAEPLIRLLFEHGRFSSADTLATAMALRAYAVGLLFFSLIKVLGPAFYALNETKIPVWASLSSVATNIVLNFALIIPFGYWGLALGSSLASVVNALILFVMLTKMLPGFSQYNLGSNIAKIMLVSAMGAGVLHGVQLHLEPLISDMFGSGKFARALAGFLSILLSSTSGCLVLLGSAKLLGLESAEQALALLLRRIKRKSIANNSEGA